MMNSTPPSSKNALRRLVIVVGVIVGVLVYAYGWQVTHIDIEETQVPTRQASVQRALHDLFAPNIFDQDTESVFAEASFQMDCSEGAPAAATPTDQAYIVISPTCGSRGDIVTVEGFNFEPHAPSALRWIPPAGDSRPLQPIGLGDRVFDTDASGHFQLQVEVPSIRGGGNAVHQIQAEVRRAVGAPYFSDTSALVFEKMVETVFLALMATTAAVPISVIVSFLAAHNLMRPIRVSLGNILVGFLLLPVGWVLGAQLFGPVGALGVTWGKDLVLGVAAPVVAIAAYGFGAQAAGRIPFRNGVAVELRRIILRILLLVLVIFSLGAIGGIGIWAGDQLADLGASIQSSSTTVGSVAGTLVSALSNFVDTLGRLVELGITSIAALVGAFLLASIGMEFTLPVLKRAVGTASYVLGGILGLLAGALLMVMVSLIGNQGALLGLLSPVVAALLGSQIPVMIYQRWFGPAQVSDRSSTAGQTVRLALMIAGGLVAFAVTYVTLDIARGVINGRLPAAVGLEVNVFGSPIVITEYVRNAATIGAVLGGIAGALSGITTAFPIGAIVYNTTRTILNGLRSIEPLIMAIVFSIWVGIGPFAGVLALMLHSIASLGKLYSEQIESIDPGPIEAILATGANRLQMIVYAVVPQIVPPYISFTMYRWDINVRMSTIIGFVGGGGIGFVLLQQINLFRYRDAGVAVLAIALVVSAMDYASAYIRERVV